MRFEKGNNAGRRFSSDNQPSKESRKRGAEKLHAKTVISKVPEVEARRYEILQELLSAPEPPGPARDAVLQVLPIKADKVTKYHALTLRMIIEAQNGKVAASRYLMNEQASLRDYMRAIRADEKEGSGAINVYTVEREEDIPEADAGDTNVILRVVD